MNVWVESVAIALPSRGQVMHIFPVATGGGRWMEQEMPLTVEDRPNRQRYDIRFGDRRLLITRRQNIGRIADVDPTASLLGRLKTYFFEYRAHRHGADIGPMRVRLTSIVHSDVDLLWDKPIRQK
jgi:hypothetical protein